jgi:hypothetical protein
MFSRYLKRTYLPSCSQLKLKKNRGTGLDNLHLLSPQEKLPSNPYPSLLYTTDTIKRGSSKGKVRPFETIVYCYFLYIHLQMGSWIGSILNLWVQLRTDFLIGTSVDSLSINKYFFQVWISHILHFISICDLFTVVVLQLYWYWCC